MSEEKPVVVMFANSPDTKDVLLDMIFEVSYADKICPVCNNLLTKEDFYDNNMFAIDHKTVAHGQCFYRFFADRLWKEKHPEFKSE